MDEVYEELLNAVQKVCDNFELSNKDMRELLTDLIENRYAED